MKAKFVYERLEFERGGDVRKKLGLGIPAIVKKLPNMVFEEDMKHQFYQKLNSGEIEPFNDPGAIIAIYYSPEKRYGEDEGQEITHLTFKSYLATYIDAEGYLLDHSDYIKYLLEKIGLMFLCEEVVGPFHNETLIECPLKREFRKFFHKDYFLRENYPFKIK